MITLHFSTQLITRAKRYRQAGQLRSAARLLRRLASFDNLPDAMAFRVHSFLGRVELQRRRPRRARRHLLAALRLCPDSWRCHLWLAVAILRENHGDLDRAARHLRRALELNPDCVAARSLVGLVDIRRGRQERGLDLLRLAARRYPQDTRINVSLIKGLRLCGRLDDAERELRLARFRLLRALELIRLQHFLRLARLRRDRELRRIPEKTEGPILLPFPQTEVRSRHQRIDQAAPLSGPHRIKLHRPGELRQAP